MKWFKHQSDAHTNLKLMQVLDEFGLEGYGLYWLIVEIIAQQGDNFAVTFEKGWKSFLKRFSTLREAKLNKMLTRFGELNLICPKELLNNNLYLPKMKDHTDEYTDKVLRRSGQCRDNIPIASGFCPSKTEQNKTEQNKTDHDHQKKGKLESVHESLDSKYQIIFEKGERDSSLLELCKNEEVRFDVGILKSLIDKFELIDIETAIEETGRRKGKTLHYTKKMLDTGFKYEPKGR